MTSELVKDAKEPTGDIRSPASGICRINVLCQAPTPEALELIPENLARKHNAVPLTIKDNTLQVAMADPDDILAIEAAGCQNQEEN